HPTSHSFYFVITRPLPPPTPFPYTTLFRSSEAARRGRARQGRSKPLAALREPAARGPVAPQRVSQEQRQLGISRDGAPQRRPKVDRKSTRLNSSHQIISYAVFCLKKKNTHT